MAAAGESGENANGISAKQIEANRRNALQSTGPRTPEGKAVSKFNAAKHWLRASRIVIPGLEDPREFGALVQELMQDWMPVGLTEIELVRELAIALWQNRRVHRAEHVDILKRVEAESHVALPMRLPRYPCAPLSDRSSELIKQLQLQVESAMDELETEGIVSRQNCDTLGSMFGEVKDNPALFLKVLFSVEMSDPLRRSAPDGITNGVNKKIRAREYLENSLKQLKDLRRKAVRREKLAAKIKLQGLSIPEGPAAERIQRYRTNAERRVHRLIDQLERLQRRRRGEPPTPTLNVQLKNDDSD